jgi:hypothetical protein
MDDGSAAPAVSCWPKKDSPKRLPNHEIGSIGAVFTIGLLMNLVQDHRLKGDRNAQHSERGKCRMFPNPRQESRPDCRQLPAFGAKYQLELQGGSDGEQRPIREKGLGVD